MVKLNTWDQLTHRPHSSTTIALHEPYLRPLQGPLKQNQITVDGAKYPPEFNLLIAERVREMEQLMPVARALGRSEIFVAAHVQRQTNCNITHLVVIVSSVQTTMRDKRSVSQ